MSNIEELISARDVLLKELEKAEKKRLEFKLKVAEIKEKISKIQDDLAK